MGSDLLACPLCGSPMAAGTTAAVGHRCDSCRARFLGLAPFEHLLQEGVGSRVWVACAATAQSGPTCPYCSQSMRSPDPQPGLPAGLAVCRLCQQVLVPASASEWMTQYAVTAAAGGIGGPPAADGTFLPSECSSCGAPYEPDENGRCRYCHTQIAAIQAPVVLEANPYATMPTSGVTTLMDLANTFLRPRRF